MSDGREQVASIFDRTSVLMGKRDGLAFTVGSGLATVVATLVRSLGPEGAKKQIEDLMARKDDGVITDDDLASDDVKVMETVSGLYDGDE